MSNKDLVSFKSLETEEGRREYYTYDPSNPVTMRHHTEPFLDPRFNEELLFIFGRDVHGDQRIRIAWAGSLRQTNYRQMEDGSSQPYEGMKYPYMRLKVIKGFSYTNDDGRKVTVSKITAVPKGKVAGEVYDWDDLSHMKFVLEMKYTAEELVRMGKYPKPGSEEDVNWGIKNGIRFQQRPNPNGEYVFCHYIETADGKYADVTDNIIESIKAIFHRAATETEPEYIARKLAVREELARVEKETADRLYSDAVENSRIKAEKKLARGKILYST